MAILDAEVMFSNRQAITATGPSSNIWDSGPYGRAVGDSGNPVYDLGNSNVELLIQVVAAFNNLTSLRVDYQVSNDPSFVAGVDTISTETKTLAGNGLVAGARFNPVKVPRRSNKRYHRLLYTVTGTAPTQGAITAAAVDGDNAWFFQK